MRGMIPEDVFALAAASDPRVSPDGRTVAFVVTRTDRERNDYRSAIWLVPADGSAPPRQFTAGTKRDGHPRWSPDGTRLAFVSNRDGDAGQLYVIPASGGEAVRLTDSHEDIEDVAWSPDGTRIAFTARVRDAAYDEKEDRKRPPRRFNRLSYKLDNVGWTVDRRKHVFTVGIDAASAPVQITKGDFEHDAPTWSSDGRRIAFTSARHDDWDIDLVRDVYVVDADGGEPELFTWSDGLSDAPSWSPTGLRIAYLYSEGLYERQRLNARLAVVDSSTRERRILTSSLDRNCAPYPPMREPVWDGDAVVFAVEDRGNTHVYRVDTATDAEPALLFGGERSVTGYDVRGGTVAYTASDAGSLTELYVGDRRVTDLTAEFTSERQLVPAERFTARSGDGTEVDAWIVKPADFDPSRTYPVLLNIHGGPFAQYGNRFFDEFQVQAGAGYVVLFANPRGSSGRAESWGRAICGPIAEGTGWGSVDYDDLMGVVDSALEQFPFCDRDRVGVLGGSYGGYMTSWIVGHTDRFKAAVSERAVNNMLSEFGSSDYGHSFRWYVGAYAFEAPDVYLKLSPSTYAQNIVTPLLIMHSENDLRCNVEQAEHLFTILRVLKREVDFVRFPGESHELSRSGAPNHRVTRFEIVLDWFRRYLQPDRA